MTTVKTGLDQPAASRMPFVARSSVPASDTQAAIEYLAGVMELQANKGQPNGYAALDGSGKVPTTQLPTSVLGAMKYQGAWNATTNTPALASGVGTQGFYYTVSVAGTTTLDGVSQWDAGDVAAYNGTTWQRFEGSVSATEIAASLGYTPANAARQVSAGGIATGGGDLSADRTITVTKSSLAQAQAGTDDATAMTPVRVADAITQFGLKKANNLSDVASAATSRTNLGLATIAATGNYADLVTKPGLSEITTALGYTAANAARTITAAGLVTGGGDLTANRTVTVTASSNAQAQTGTDTTTAMTPASTVAGVTQIATLKANNLSDVASAATSRINLGITREPLSAARTYYVRSDGSDSNTGLVNSAGGAFLTLQKAWNVLVTLDQNAYTVTIKLANTATFTGGINGTISPTGPVVIQGDTGTSTNTLISTTSADALRFTTPCNVTIQNLALKTTTSGYCVYSGTTGAIVTIGASVVFQACANSHMRAISGGYIFCGSAYSITGAASYHMDANVNGIFEFAGANVTITGTPAFTAFAYASALGVISNYAPVYAGSATGKRYDVSLNAVMNAFGNTLPGSIAGTTATGGQAA